MCVAMGSVRLAGVERACALWIPVRLPGLNELVAARARRGSVRSGTGKRWSAYSDIKRAAQETISACALAQHFQAPEGPCHFNYLFCEPEQKRWRRDPSNILAGGQKLIEDALVSSGLLKGDGPDVVAGITAYFLQRKPEGVFVLLQDCPVISMRVMTERLYAYGQNGRQS